MYHNKANTVESRAPTALWVRPELPQGHAVYCVNHGIHLVPTRLRFA